MAINSSFDLFQTSDTPQAASRCACQVQGAVLTDALNTRYRALTDDYGNTVGVRPAAAWDRAHHYGYGWSYLSERMGAPA